LTYIPGVDFFVYWVAFPEDSGTDGGCVTPNDDGTFSILMDKRLLCQMRKAKKTYRHEVEHIEDDDFYNGKPIKDIEKI
jgi:hypothetical protein